MSDPRERAMQLVELACSTTSEEEARTAALTAVRLIKKHGLLDGRMYVGVDRAGEGRDRTYVHVSQRDIFDAIFGDGFHAARARQKEQAHQSRVAREQAAYEEELRHREHVHRPPPPRQPLPVGGIWRSSGETRRCVACGCFCVPGARMYVLDGAWWCADHPRNPAVKYPPRYGTDRTHNYTPGLRRVCACCSNEIPDNVWAYVGESDGAGQTRGEWWCHNCYPS